MRYRRKCPTNFTHIKEARKLTQNEVDKIRDALDIIQNIRQLREEKRVLENKPRSTRRGVLMNQLQTLGIWVNILWHFFAIRLKEGCP